MRKILFWVEENWEAALALFLLLAVLIYDCVHLISPKVSPASIEVVSYIIMLMLGNMTVMLMRMRRSGFGQIEQFINRLILDHAGRNPFIESWIRSQLELLKDLERDTFGATSFNTNDLVEATRCTKRGDEIQAIDYGPGWKPDFEQLLRENIEARKRGVTIRRVFIVPDSIARDSERAKSLWETMVEQSANDISVTWVAQTDLKNSFPKLAIATRGMALFHYGRTDCSLLMLDAPDAHLVLLSGGQPGFEVYWGNHDEVRKRQEDFRELDNLILLKKVGMDVNAGDPPPFFKRVPPSEASSR